MNPSAQTYWRSLQELADSAQFGAFVERSAPRFRHLVDAFDRRKFLQLMAASIALGSLDGCGEEVDRRQLLPYVEQPEGIIPGRESYYTTAFTLGGYGAGVMIGHQMARPIKVEGNPDHPASLGAANAMMQASILGLYDPRRAQTILGNGQIETWESFVTALFNRREALSAAHGAGLRILTGSVTSPSLIAQLNSLLQQFPAMQWHQWEAVNRDNEFQAARLAFGAPAERIFDLHAADVIFAVESDVISSVPGALAYARQFANRRRPAENAGAMNRTYAIESTPTLLGAKADHRLAMNPNEIQAAVKHLAGLLGVGPQDWTNSVGAYSSWLQAAADDLHKANGRALIHVGREQPVEVHALADAINASLGGLGKTVRLIEPISATAISTVQSLADLVADMKAGKVDTLLMFETNPVYTAPADLDFASALRRVPFSLALTDYEDETARASVWQIPAAHEYEAWRDVRAFDGTVTIQQPQVRPLYGGRTPMEVLAVLGGETAPNDYTLLQNYWKKRAKNENRGDFATFWNEVLRRGLVDRTAAASASVSLQPGLVPKLPNPAPEANPQEISLLFRPDEALWDGRFSNNAWLLEMPRAFTRLTWDNAALIAPATAERLGLDTHDVVEISTKTGTLKAPVFVLPGQAPDCVTLPLGWGRASGGLGEGIGFDAFPLRNAGAPWQASGASITKTADVYSLATTQDQDRLQGQDLVHEVSLIDLSHPPHTKEADVNETLYPPFEYAGRAWAMAVDLNSCIGCQACVLACQAENNVPVVGKDQVLAGRAMHWLRIDRYYSGAADAPRTAFEPMPCMHCEDAPCEVVCPVHATVHDHEGLNLMVYNRCVGTRFCSNNCPYKVRRFNFFNYSSQNERPPDSWNPDVTVRARGVMEKCTYCIQRIREAEISADRENRPVKDGEVVTACQQSCPTQAIVFGDRNDAKSAVVRRKSLPGDYVLMDELNTRPRTSYGPLLRNPNPSIKNNA